MRGGGRNYTQATTVWTPTLNPGKHRYDVGEENSLKLNVNKTKTVDISDDYESIIIKHEEVGRVEHLKYPSSTKTQNAFCTKGISARLAM